MAENFTINLVSNASMQLFPTNTMARFTTLLPQKMELLGDWEVAVLEVSWPAKVKNITNSSFAISRFDAASRPTRPNHNQTIPDGYYPTIDTLMTKLMQTIYQDARIETGLPVSWEVDTVTQKLQVCFTGRAPTDQFCLLFKSEDLSNTLGITDTIYCTVETQKQKGYAVRGTYPIDLQGGRHTMFLYCDLIQNEILGDAQTSLLRAIPLETNSAAAITSKTFNKLQWKRINKTNFQSITMSLCDERGHLMPFVSVGRTNLTLAFRRRNSFGPTRIL